MKADGCIDAGPLNSDHIPLDELLPRGLHRLEEHRSDTLKILVEPGR